MRIELADNQVGDYNGDGSYKVWPELDILGKPYARENATVRRIDQGRHFVVIPLRKDSDEYEFVLPGAIKPPVPEEPAGAAPAVTDEPTGAASEQVDQPADESPFRKRGRI